MRSAFLFAMAPLLMGAVPAAADDLLARARDAFQPVPAQTQAAQGHEAALVRLGKTLFFDPRLSGSGALSCNACHNLGLAGSDLHPTSLDDTWTSTPRNAPTVLNAGLNGALYWDGRAADLTAQAAAALLSPGEMNGTRERVEATLRSLLGYRVMFRQAFPAAAEPATLDNAAAALAAFQATLTTPDSRFDRYLRGDTAALDGRERDGLALFMDKGCAGCHGGVNLGGSTYYPFGVVEKPAPALLPPADRGREAVTADPTDAYFFRTAPLRNVALTAPYFHSGAVASLGEAVSVMAATQLGTTLSADEVQALTAFLGTLSGTMPAVDVPRLPAPAAPPADG